MIASEFVKFYYIRIILSDSKKSKKSVNAFLFKNAIFEQDLSAG